MNDWVMGVTRVAGPLGFGWCGPTNGEAVLRIAVPTAATKALAAATDDSNSIASD
jgi:hypothetical protein